IIVLPKLTETQEAKSTDLNALLILEEVVEVLRKEKKEIDRNTKEFLGTEGVIENYQEPIRDQYLQDLTHDEKQEVL
ncbi:sodium:proton antiporter, partial [Enterococcus faecium]